jgi:uncharacterized protein
LDATQSTTKSTHRFQILALSGGGYRGLYTATLLAALERAAGKPLARCFDLLTGTSVGGMLALGLALEIPALRLAELFSEHGSEIFDSQLSLGGYLRARYSRKSLQALLTKPTMYGERLLGDCQHRVVIPAVNYSTGQPVMFKTPHHPKFLTDHAFRVVDIALATSAAPFYFSRHRFNHNQYIDGGLYANAPGLLGVHEAETFLNQSAKNVHLLSIGTMSSAFTVDPSRNSKGGVCDWGRGRPVKAAQRLFGITISVQESVTHNMLMHRLTEERFTLLDDVLTPDRANAVALDKTDFAAGEVLVGTAKERAKHALGMPIVQTLLQHHAPAARVYHGARANVTNEVLSC